MKHRRIFALLIACIPLAAMAQTDEPTEKATFYGGVAININSNATAKNSPYANAGGKDYTSYLPALYMGINIPTDPEVGKTVFRIEVSAAFAKYNSMYTNKVDPYVDVRASFNSMDIALTPQIIYNFYNADNFKIYAGAGLSISGASYTKAYYGPQDPSVLFQVSNDYDFVGFDTRALLKAGVQVYRHVEVFFNYLTNAETTNRGYFQLNRSNEHIGVIYLFK